MQNVKLRTFGEFFERPMDVALEKFSQDCRLSQPPHLLHLGIVKDVAQVKKISHYHFYTYTNFKKLVDSGEANWKELVGGPTSQDSAIEQDGKTVLGTEDPDVDQYGFSRLHGEDFADERGVATMSDISKATGALPYILSGLDLGIVPREDGSNGISIPLPIYF